MTEYIFLIRGPRPNQPTPEEFAEIMGAWESWSADLTAKDQLVRCLPLETEARAVCSKDGVKDYSAADAKEVGGYVIVKANNLDDATEIAQTCPALKYDGGIEIRTPMNM